MMKALPREISRRQALRLLRALARFTAVLCGAAPTVLGAQELVVKSPNKRVRFTVLVGDGHLRYEAALNDRPMIEPSALGIAVDGVDLGQGASIGRAEPYRLDESYPWRGVHSRAVNRCNGARVSVIHAASRTPFTVDVHDPALHALPGRPRRLRSEERRVGK